MKKNVNLDLSPFSNGGIEILTGILFFLLIIFKCQLDKYDQIFKE